MRLQPPDQLSTALIWGSAIFMAIREGASHVPSMTSLADAMGGAWSFAPLFLLLLAGAIMVGRALAGAGNEATDTSAAQLAQSVIDASNRLVASRPKLPDPSAPKQFVPESFARRYLDAINQERTEIQVEALLHPHLNSWMRLSGKVRRTNKTMDSITMYLVDATVDDNRPFVVKFHLSWAIHLANVNVNDTIAMNVQIVDTGYGIELMNAELL